MTNTSFYLNEIKVNPPKNWQEFGIELNFDKDKASVDQQVSLTQFEFNRDESDMIYKWQQDGITSGVGVFEGMPFRIEVARNGVVEVPFKGYIDVGTAQFDRDSCIVNATENNRIDWLNEIADSFTFEHLNKTVGLISQADFDHIPYVITSVPNYMDAAVATLGVYVMVKEIKDAIQKIAELTADAPVYYVFSTYIKIILYIIYLILLIIALVKLVKNIILLIIQPVKYHACMSVKTQCEKAAQYLNMRFDCPMLNDGVHKDLYIIPQKYYNQVNQKEKQLFGFTEPSIVQDGYYKGTFGDLLRELKKFFNAKIMIVGDTIRLVRDDFTTSVNQYTLPPIYNRKQTLNVDEFKANYLISFQTDSIDKNTIQDYLGTSYQVIIEPSRVNNTGMTLMKGLEDVRLNFALARRKETLTNVENILSKFIEIFSDIAGAMVTAVNAIIEVLNIVIAIVNDILDKLASIGIKLNFRLPDIPLVDFPDFKSVFKNRVGMLKLETDIINVPKIFIMDKGSSAKYNKIHGLNMLYVSGKYLYNEYHFVNSFLPTAEKPNGNQYIKKTFDEVPFTFDDFEKVRENNCIFTESGSEALVDSLKWNVWNQTASMNIRINKLYSNNFNKTVYEPDGR